MGELVECRFFGGPADGRVMKWDLVGLNYVIKIPETSGLFHEHWLDEVDADLGEHEEIARRRAETQELWDATPTSPIPALLPRVTTYHWDGTVSETGERRMRWSGRFI